MATLTDLSTLILATGPFVDKVRAAMMITAYNIKNEDPGTANHVNRLALVKQWLIDPETWDNRVARYIIGANNALASAQAITDLPDTDIKAHVDASVDVFVGA